jgi:outer membrane protein assembly factor BamB
MRIVTALAIALLAAAPAIAQVSKWESKLKTEIYNPVISPNGKHMLFFTDDDSIVVHLANLGTGAEEWNKTLNKFKQFRVSRFIGNDTVLVGEENRYEFLNAKDGSLYKSLPIVGDSWNDIVWENTADENDDTLRPYFEGDLAIFYFDDGMQILDLANASIIHQTETSPGKIRYKKWDNMMMINPVSGGDSVYFLDMTAKKLVYTASKDKNDINSSVYQPFVASLGTLLLFNEDNIQSIDITTGKENATIDVDPDDPELYTPVIFKNSLGLLVSDEDVQKMYDAKTGKLLWSTPQDSVPGVIDQLVELPNEQGLMMAYESGGKMKAYKIDAKTGKILWKHALFVQDGSYEPGHKEGSKVWATIGKIALTIAVSYLSRGSYGSGYHGSLSDPNYFFRQSQWDMQNQWQRRYYERQRDEQRRDINNMYNSWINKKKKSEGYVTVLNQDSTSVMLVSAGKIYNAEDDGSAREYDGEGIMKLNIADGKILSQTKCPMISAAENKNFNAVKDLNIQKFDSARTLLGVHDLYVLRGDSLEHMNFGDGTLAFINSGRNELTFWAHDDDKETYDYWRVDVASVPATKYLIARSYTKNLVFGDTSRAVNTTLLVTEDSIAAFPVRTGDIAAGTFTNPKWVLDEDALDKLDLGRLDKNITAMDSLQGIRIDGGDVILMGDDGLGFVSSDGACRWSNEWSPSLFKKKLGVSHIGDAIVYSTNGVTQVISTKCPVEKVTEEISYSDTMILTSPNHEDVIVLDTDDGVVHGYHVKK